MHHAHTCTGGTVDMCSACMQQPLVLLLPSPPPPPLLLLPPCAITSGSAEPLSCSQCGPHLSSNCIPDASYARCTRRCTACSGWSGWCVSGLPHACVLSAEY
jgi:hypothetical protein